MTRKSRMSSFPDNFSATKSSSESTKSRGEPVVGFSSASGHFLISCISTEERLGQHAIRCDFMHPMNVVDGHSLRLADLTQLTSFSGCKIVQQVRMRGAKGWIRWFLMFFLNINFFRINFVLKP